MLPQRLPTGLVGVWPPIRLGGCMGKISIGPGGWRGSDIVRQQWGLRRHRGLQRKFGCATTVIAGVKVAERVGQRRTNVIAILHISAETSRGDSEPGAEGPLDYGTSAADGRMKLEVERAASRPACAVPATCGIPTMQSTVTRTDRGVGAPVSTRGACAPLKNTRTLPHRSAVSHSPPAKDEGPMTSDQ
jgi:hypothetical protein